MSDAPVRIVEVAGEVQPDNSFPDAHAIYLVLSHEPSAAWQRAFDEVCRLKVATRHRPITVVGDRLRVVIAPTEHLQTVVNTVQAAVRLTNERIAQRKR